MSAFVAQYNGRCADCGGRIMPGDSIRRRHTGGAADDFVHDVCRDDPAIALRASETVCSSCFMVKPCPCDNGQ